MPLHLLGKKSWNVYNHDNIEKVKRDEAAAASREAAEEQRMQEVDAERRIRLLRGETLPDTIGDAPPSADRAEEHKGTSQKRERKRRRIAGEDDTERDIRFALEDESTKFAAKADLQLTHKKTSDAPLMDRHGHIDLFPMGGSRHNAPKNAEVEAEKAKKKKEFEDQYTMRFSNAAGFKQSIGEKPWYQAIGTGQDDPVDAPSKDVWGNEDPRRKEREKLRVAADDPMAVIQKGVTQLRQVERERQQWQEERNRETRDSNVSEKRRKRKSRRRHEEEEEELVGFSLDAPTGHDSGGEKHAASHRHRHRHRHRQRSGSNERSEERYRRHRDPGKKKDNSRETSRSEPILRKGYSSQLAQIET
ncbi:MAG: hypothetical protein LQ345_004930 [Seirophora villosa]|nr:MAG: hypothetical protein LQ345_004930 [Seirophora villosa]